MSEIMVSVVCLAYNHENYIEDALKGILTQKTNFKYEIIVHDDASDDGTVRIIQNYKLKYPDIIRTICQKENQYSKKKNMQFLCNMYASCKSRYIALCDGDDFWIDPHKLQRQVDFLEYHPDYVLTTHNAVRLVCANGKLEAMNPYSCSRTLDAEDIIMQYNGNVPTASVMVRTEILINSEALFWKYDVGDWPLQLACIMKGKIYYDDRLMSIYRFAHQGSWTINWEKDFDKTFEHCIGMIDFLTQYERYSGKAYSKYIISKMQIYAAAVLDMLKPQNTKRFFDKCSQYNEDDKYYPYVNELKRVYDQTYKEDYYDPTVKEFIAKNRHVLIFGAGDYGARIAKQLMKHKVGVDGFIVSELRNEETVYMDKPVWRMGKIPFDNSVGIIVGIKPVIWNQLADVLEKNNYINYICPFLFKPSGRKDDEK